MKYVRNLLSVLFQVAWLPLTTFLKNYEKPDFPDKDSVIIDAMMVTRLAIFSKDMHSTLGWQVTKFQGRWTFQFTTISSLFFNLLHRIYQHFPQVSFRILIFIGNYELWSTKRSILSFVMIVFGFELRKRDRHKLSG